MTRNDRHYTVEMDGAEEMRLLDRLAALRTAGAVIDFSIESMWVDPFDKVRLQDFLSDLERKG